MKKVVATISLQQLRDTRARGKVIRHLADKTGLLYFGAVDHHRDEHDVVRGLTVSTSHKDKHYAVGTYDGYDIALVDRYDVTKSPQGTLRHNWVIIQISLLKAVHIPSVFILPLHRADRFSHLFTGLRHMAPIEQFSHATFPHEFASRYTVYVPPQHHLNAYDWLSQPLTARIAAHFWPHAIEFKEGKIYVYITEHRLTETVLGSAVESALWLADALDQRAD